MPRQVTPRTMRTQIVLQAAMGSINTRGEEVKTWADVATVYAEATPVRARDVFAVGYESLAAGKIQTPVDVVFRIRWRTGIGAGHRVLWRGDAYEIHGEPIDVDGMRTTLEIMAIKGVRDGR